MATTILLIRHAEHVEYDRRLSGRRPGILLSDRGERQAQRLARRLRKAGIGRVEASPLERTLATAAAIAAAADLPAPRIVPALVEIDMGDWSGRRLDGFGDDPQWHDWNHRRATARIPGGESMAEAQARIVDHCRALVHSDPERTVALVTHADLIRGCVAAVLGLSLDHLLRFDVDPASVTRTVWGDWGAKVETLNARGEA